VDDGATPDVLIDVAEGFVVELDDLAVIRDYAIGLLLDVGGLRVHGGAQALVDEELQLPFDKRPICVE